MVVNIPTKDDFLVISEALIYEAWINIRELLILKNNVENSDTGHESKSKIIVIVPMIHQSIEMYLKGSIVEISPYLILINHTKVKSRNKIDFSKFKTLNSSDLFAVYNTFSKSPLNEDYEKWFNDLRSHRNKLTHSVEPNYKLFIKELLKHLDMAYKIIYGEHKWINNHFMSLLANYKKDYADSIAEAFSYFDMHSDISDLSKYLEESDELLVDYLGKDNSFKSIYCPKCISKIEKVETYERDMIDNFIPTLQPICDKVKNYKCIACGYEHLFKICDICVLADENKSGICKWCLIRDKYFDES